MVDPPSELMKSHPVSSKVGFELHQIKIEQIANGTDADCFHSGFGDLSNSRNATHGQGLEEALRFVWLNNKETVRFLPIRRNLRQELVRRDTG